MFMRLAIVRLMGMRKMGEVLSKRLFPKMDESLRQMFVARWAENDIRAYLDTMRAIIGWSVADKIQTIKMPGGRADNDYTPVSAKEAYIPTLGNAKLVVIDDSRHAVPVEKPEEFNRIVLEFLSKNT